jgi:hypothetical protein
MIEMMDHVTRNNVARCLWVLGIGCRRRVRGVLLTELAVVVLQREFILRYLSFSKCLRNPFLSSPVVRTLVEVLLACAGFANRIPEFSSTR